MASPFTITTTQDQGDALWEMTQAGHYVQSLHLWRALGAGLPDPRTLYLQVSPEVLFRGILASEDFLMTDPPRDRGDGWVYLGSFLWFPVVSKTAEEMNSGEHNDTQAVPAGPGPSVHLD